MDPDVVNISVVTHISQLHGSMIAHGQDPYFKFHKPTVSAGRLLWSLPTIAPWTEDRIRGEAWTEDQTGLRSDRTGLGPVLGREKAEKWHEIPMPLLFVGHGPCLGACPCP